MKKHIGIMLPLFMAFILAAGCSGGENSSGSSRGDYIDLTVLSSTVLSAEINNIMTNPGSYIGKTIRVRGSYSVTFDQQAGGYLHFVITKDGDECCREGFEFILAGDHVFPDGYPEIGAGIEVAGVFERYSENGLTYYRLADGELSVLY